MAGNSTSHAKAWAERTSKARKIMASDMTTARNSATVHCSDPPNKHLRHVQYAQGICPARPMRPGLVQGWVNHSRPSWRRSHGRATRMLRPNKPRVGCTRSDQEVGSPWQQRSSNVRLEYKADDLGRAGLVAHRTANRYGAWTRGNSKTQPAAHYVFSGEDLPKCPRKLPYQTAVQRDSPEDRAAAGARFVGACPLWDRLD